MVANALSEATRRDKPEVAAFVRELVMRQDPEGYARNCEALAGASDPGPSRPACRCCSSPAETTRPVPRPSAKRWPKPTARPPSRSSTASATGPPLEAAREVTDLLLKFSDHAPSRRSHPCPSSQNGSCSATSSILDSTGAQPYPGDVLVENDRIAAVGAVDPAAAYGARVIDGGGRTLMSGLCDAHTHFTWNNSADLDGLGTMPVEEHLLFCMESARTYIDSGYTMCLGAASAKERLDVVCRDAINAGRFPGPRYLANGPEIAVTGGALIKSITKFADGPEGMRRAVRELVDIGVDQIKLSMTGEEITGTQRAEDTYFSDEEVRRRRHRGAPPRQAGLRPRPQRRERQDVRPQPRRRVYHASFTDADGMDMLEANKDWVFVAPGLNWLVATLYEAEAFGFPQEAAEAVGYKKELEMAEAGLREMHRRGIKVLPGGDYGFAWTPHGTYARDLQHFVERLGFTPMEAIISATAWAARSCSARTSSARSSPATSPTSC